MSVPSAGSPVFPQWLANAVEQDGCALVPDVLPPETVAELQRAVEQISPDPSAPMGRGSASGIRNLLQLVPEVRELVASSAVRNLVAPVLGPGAFPTRGILFDKRPETNWKVGWHQDLIIAVQSRQEVPGFTGWSVKAGVVHAHPPVEVLERMLTVRLHLDACGRENAPLRVIPGSHARGKLTESGIRTLREQTPERACCLPAGGALVLRPLLLHASSAATRPGHRRVLHLEFAADPLPGGLEWVIL